MLSRSFAAGCILTIVLVASSFAGDPLREGGGCFSIVVGKAASVDGSVIMAHNEDDFVPQVVNHHKVARETHDAGEFIRLEDGGTLEQVPETWSHIWSEIPGLLFSDSYLNEWGVCICSDACPSREDSPVLTDGGITKMLRRIVAERAKSAREGVQIAASLIERFGYGAPGRTYIISDPNEGWLLAVVYGKHWVARRVPDDQVAMISNTYTIHEVDLADTLNFLGSADLIDYAVARGWYDPQTDGAFDFAKAYADPEVAADARNIGRQWDGLCQVAQTGPVYGTPLPFSSVPEGRIGVGQVMKVFRRHYEGTELYASDSATGCPHGNKVTPICRNDTQTSFVVQLRGFLPLELGLVYWTTLSSPCASCYVPFYFGVDSFPASYGGPSEPPTDEEYAAQVSRPFAVDEGSAFWTFTRLRHTVEQQYPKLAPVVRGLLDGVETDALERQSAVDAQALSAWANDSRRAMRIPMEYTDGLLKDIMTRLRGIGAAQ